MKSTTRTGTVLLGVVLPLLGPLALSAMEVYEDLDTGYSMDIANGWVQRFDGASGSLLMKAPGGLRIRLIAQIQDRAPRSAI